MKAIKQLAKALLFLEPESTEYALVIIQGM